MGRATISSNLASGLKFFVLLLDQGFDQVP